LIHVATGQPYRLPGKARITQDQRMYEMVKSQGVKAAIEWFRAKGKKAAWGGTNLALAQQLIKDGRVDAGLQLMELELELTPGKVWLLRKAALAYLSNGRPEDALVVLNRGLELRPDHSVLKSMKAEAKRDVPTK
jgi:predicted Zn-dependent protease